MGHQINQLAQQQTISVHENPMFWLYIGLDVILHLPPVYYRNLFFTHSSAAGPLPPLSGSDFNFKLTHHMTPHQDLALE